jgi:hypothetical protein
MNSRALVPASRDRAIIFDAGYMASVRENDETQAAARKLGLEGLATWGARARRGFGPGESL